MLEEARRLGNVHHSSRRRRKITYCLKNHLRDEFAFLESSLFENSYEN